MTSSHGGNERTPRPSLRALEVFAAAARTGGFTAAGRDLGITQSAVSRQIADLEGMLGIHLFTRRGARLALTPTGQRLSERVGRALDDARAAVAEVAASERVVTLSMLPSVAARWLAPRLGRFTAAHPEIDLRITASRHLVDFAAEGVDGAIRYGRAPASGLVAILLADETITPVCAPGYAARFDLNAASDLGGAVLLHGDLPENWDAWFATAGLDHPAPRGPRLGDDTAILQAAVEGQGIALGRSRLVEEDIVAGRLIAPFDISLPASHAYWFVRPDGVEASGAVHAAEAWIREEFEKP